MAHIFRAKLGPEQSFKSFHLERFSWVYAGLMSTYGPVEKAARAELRNLGLSVQSSVAAAALVAVARKLDQTTGAASAAAAGREVRLAIGALRQPETVDSDLAELFTALG
jgi:hypothetical protein